MKEEIFYREGVTLGLDRDDAVVRRRLGQKLEFIIESGAASPRTPSCRRLDSHVGKIDPTYSLRQVYFDRHGMAAS